MRGRAFLGLDDTVRKPTVWSRLGLTFSGLFLVASGTWITATSERLPPAISLALLAAGLLIIAVSGRKRLNLTQVNVLTFLTHISALLTFYLLTTRFLVVTYSTDTIVGTYAGLLGVLQLQNPYLYSIKPFLEQFGLPPSYYTPRVDGSFEFRLNYPAFNFLSLIPVYLAGLHDLRDGILVFHLVSILLIFGLTPARVKAISLTPFVFGFPLAVVFSWTDSVWASLLLVAAVAWYRDRRLGLAFVGLAGATKQIALVVAPFLLIRLWHESSGSKRRETLMGFSTLLMGFFVSNIPFIVLSPFAWWAGTVTAYLPGKAPQVVGGVGLSEVLIVLGISLPSLFFVAMMAFATVGTIYLYHSRFHRFKHFAWAMPILILFFYYRSFPNYMIYWLFPLLPEILRYKPGGLGLDLRSMFRRPQWHASFPLSVSSVRRRMTSSGLLVLLLTAVLAGVSGAYISRASEPRVQVHVDRVIDRDSIGAATTLETTLVNLGTEPVSPRFFIKWYVLPFLWTTNSTAILPPGGQEHYNLTATDGRAAIPRGTPFKVLIFNSIDGNLMGQSQNLLADLPTPSVANPFFRWWTLDSETGRKVPFGWRLAMVGVDETSGISEIDSALGEGLQLTLNHTSRTPRLQEIIVSPKETFEAPSLRMLVLLPQEAGPEEGIVFGARFTDTTHTLYFLFSTAASERTVNVYPGNTTIITPIVSEEWTMTFLDSSQEWVSLGWPLPKSIEFSIVLRSSSTGVSYAYVKEIA